MDNIQHVLNAYDQFASENTDDDNILCGKMKSSSVFFENDDNIKAEDQSEQEHNDQFSSEVTNDDNDIKAKEESKQDQKHHVKLFSCNHCGKVANGYKKLMDHVRLHIKATCSICHKEVIKRQLSKHLEWCMNGQKRKRKNLTCATCGYNASSTKRLEAHYNTHKVKSVKIHTCGNCDYKSKNPAHVRRHEDKCFNYHVYFI